ncbi:MAG: hypothetical protein M1819_005538 [Sarea resinae]|nr:MAG: hypothetical protein M1819_005538 [Sarea resinae]
MLSSGFTNAPVSNYLLLYIVASSILVSLADYKYLFYIQVVPHLWRYWQAWRLLIWQDHRETVGISKIRRSSGPTPGLDPMMKSTDSGQSFLFSIFLYSTLISPLLLALVIRPLTFNHINYLPAGPTTLVFALLAQYHATIPHVYKYTIATSSSQNSLIFSSKSPTYLLAGQLALSQLPGSAIVASVGWFIGYAWRREILPGAAKWRVPGWILREKRQGERFEGLRRRLEGEEAIAASGVEGRGAAAGRQRRPLGSQILDQFRGAF